MSSKVNKELLDFVRTAEAENSERLEASLKEKGRAPYLELEQGENKVTILPKKPTSRTNNFGKDQWVFKVAKGGEEKDWGVTKSSPMAIKVIRKLAQAPCEIVIIRTGRGQATRIDLKE